MTNSAKNDEDESPVAERQQSLCELKDAFSRMRDLSGADLSSIAGSRQVSDTEPNCIDEESKKTVRGEVKVLNRPSLDLAGLDRGLRAVIDASTRATGSDMSLCPKGDQNLSISDSTSSGMMTCHTSMTEVEANSEMSRAQSGRSWHTAKEDTIRQLPRSKSRSTHDLASLATSKNLVEQLEDSQGEGWWSADKRLKRRTSDIEQIKSRRKSDADDEEDRKLAALERLARSLALPHRERLADAEAPPSPSPLIARSTRARPASVMEPRSRPIESDSANKRQSTDESRLTAQPRFRAVFYGPRPSLVAGSTWMDAGFEENPPSPRRRALTRRASALACALDDDTPTRDVVRRGPFVSNKISPDIARRASWIARRHSEMESSVASVAQSPASSRRTTSTSVTVPSEDGNTEPIDKIAERHALELDAVLNSLSVSKDEVRELKEEVLSLHRLLAEGLGEREELRSRCRSMQEEIERLGGKKRRSLGLAIKGAELSKDG